MRLTKTGETMNKQMLSEMRYKRVKVRPIARRIDPSGVELDQIDDVWSLATTSREEISLHNDRTHHNVPLGTDHVREYMTDSAGRTDGFLILKSQIVLYARGAVVEPLV
jgi:hypothetical protein